MYNCASNHSLVLINWIFNNTIPLGLPQFAIGVTAEGVGTTNSSLTIPGLVNPFNNTAVKCIAFGTGLGEFGPFPVILRIQGRLDPVTNLTAVQSNGSCCYRFNWSPPFTLPGVPILGYNISVTNNNGAVLHINTVAATEWEYCPKEFGCKNVNIAAVNGVGEGITANTTISITESKQSI